ncbi:MAG: hypothetical protein WCT14_15805 [Treponemataceae bacterium]
MTVERTLIDGLNFQARSLASSWKDLIRKSPQLKHYIALGDDQLIDMNTEFYPVLARGIERGMDRNSIGAYFVRIGKERMRMGFPVSEVLYAVNLVQKTVISYLSNECMLDSSAQLYQLVDVMTRLSEYFLLGSFYLTKGFLEETYIHMNAKDAVSEELLKKYFRDDFFFK